MKEESNFIPVNLLNASHYCRRLAYLQFAHQEWKDTADTIKGRRIHKRVDKEKGSLPSSDHLKILKKPVQVKSLTLSSQKLGLISKMDLLETKGAYVIPIEYKKGSALKERRSEDEFFPEEIQLCAQSLILKDNGYLCKEGAVYYANSTKRVPVDFTDNLINQTKQTIENLKTDIEKPKAPEPLKDSSKCPKCSLVEICLPDEFYFLQKTNKKVRPISIANERKFPLYVQSYEGKISKKGYRLEIKTEDEEVKSVSILDLSQLVLMGNISVTTPCLHELFRREIPVIWHSYGGWFLASSQGIGHKNALLREMQYKKSFDKEFCLNFSKSIVKAKIMNCRTLLRRNWPFEEKPKFLLMNLKKYAEQSDKAKSFKELLGIEGYAAKLYFQEFNQLIKNKDFSFYFDKRSRRPPEDPVNLLLSFSYAMLTRLWTVTLSAVGFDTFRGFYHKSRYGRPALALDMMEAFRPLICDSTVLLAINNGELKANQFIHSGGKIGWTEKSRKSFISTFERRLEHKIAHPIFNYTMSYRQLLEAQARLLVRYLFEEIKTYPHFMTR